MSHFAKLDSNSIVTEVIVAEQDFINSGIVGDAFLWVQTSYNGKFRGRAASIGGKYNKALDRFEGVQEYPSWALNEETLDYEAPTPYPTDDLMYSWDEDTTSWVEVVEPA